MSDGKKTEAATDSDGRAKLKAPRKIVLKKTVEDGSIKQSFAHGRTKNVAVEVRRKRTFVKPGAKPRLGDGKAASLKDAVFPPDEQGASAETKESSKLLKKPQILTPMSPEERKAFLEEKERKKKEEAKQKREEAKAKKAQEAEEKARLKEEAAQAKKEAAEAKKAAKEKADAEKKAAAEAKKAAAEEEAEKGKTKAPVEEKADPKEKAPAKKKAAAKKDAEPEPAAEPAPAPEPAPEPAGDQEFVEQKSLDKLTDEELAALSAETALAVDGVPNGTLSTEAEPVPLKNLSKSERDELARNKSQALMVKRMAQLEELRKQKRDLQALQEERKKRGDAEKETAAGKAAAPPPGRKEKPSRKKGKRGGPMDPEERAFMQRPGRGRGGRRKKGQQADSTPMAPVAPIVRDVIIHEAITVGELASRMAVKGSEVVKTLFSMGSMVTINQILDQDTAVLVVEEMGHKPKIQSEEADIEAELAEAEDTEKDLAPRPPVVTVMGHVDHGKTSLLDAIRKTDVTAGEHGGITQHIGAYQVTLENDSKITFLDTPGHAAFTQMRSRGAKVTDMVILVVAADDGVMPQTIEAINHAKSADVPIVVAVNKIDKQDANPDKVMQQLTEYELIAEAYGGDTIFAPVSAITGEGLESLEEMLLLQAEVMDLSANASKSARGVVVEARLDKGRGPVATCLVQSGTLRAGDLFVAGAEWGRIRGLVDDKGRAVKEAPPAMPVEILGLSGVPSAGDDFVVVPDERRARDIASFRQRKIKDKEQAKQAKANLGDIFDKLKDSEVKELKVVLKGDVQGSVEAITDALTSIEHEEIRVNVIHTGVGGLNESDLMLAAASDAIPIGFNVRADAKAREVAEQEQIELRFYNVIYDLVNDIRAALEGMLSPETQETVLGRADVLEVFKISKIGNIAGCRIVEGHVNSEAFGRLLRDNVVIFEGPLSSLKHFKKDVKDVKMGEECGIGLEAFNDIKTGDVIEAYTKAQVKRTLD